MSKKESKKVVKPKTKSKFYKFMSYVFNSNMWL